jgi:uncharacterized membrane protein YeaQ/YmgE (transglycosylase-associated protein family)
MQPLPTTGLYVGLVLGLAWAVTGFGGFLLTAALGAVGFVIGKILSGQLDLTSYLGGRNR